MAIFVELYHFWNTIVTCWLVQTNLDGFRAQIAPIQAISVVFPNQHYVEKDDYFRLWMVEYLMDTPKYFETIFVAYFGLETKL